MTRQPKQVMDSTSGWKTQQKKFFEKDVKQLKEPINDNIGMFNIYLGTGGSSSFLPLKNTKSNIETSQSRSQKISV